VLYAHLVVVLVLVVVVVGIIREIPERHWNFQFFVKLLTLQFHCNIYKIFFLHLFDNIMVFSQAIARAHKSVVALYLVCTAQWSQSAY